MKFYRCDRCENTVKNGEASNLSLMITRHISDNSPGSFDSGIHKAMDICLACKEEIVSSMRRLRVLNDEQAALLSQNSAPAWGTYVTGTPEPSRGRVTTNAASATSR